MKRRTRSGSESISKRKKDIWCGETRRIESGSRKKGEVEQEKEKENENDEEIENEN